MVTDGDDNIGGVVMIINKKIISFSLIHKDKMFDYNVEDVFNIKINI
ncbi:hypothetical protein MWH05_01710 [Candidatus Blochmanniella pennsylvanica]|nr:hypothetical protein [Candidatus Blochmannia pennsylvanicus]UOY04646.1 hypothetical protein MWH05_01710 [Candidatus Blochmannia pennsylvanicus]